MAADAAAAVVAAASAVPSAAESPLSVVVTLTCVNVEMTAACVPDASCVSVFGEGWTWTLSQPMCAVMVPIERTPAPVNVCANAVAAVAASAQLDEPGATATVCEPD